MAAEAEEERLIARIRELVACESPSDDPSALEACAAIVARHLNESGAQVERHGPHVTGRWHGTGARVLLLAHFDTVWPAGQIQRQPIEIRDGRLFGPGVLDMKAGLAIAIAAMRKVSSLSAAGSRAAVTMLVTSDEEVGSTSSRPLIERLARESDAVLVFEPALPGGALKTARKGVGEFTVSATGIASHAGVNPAAGASAITEIARQVLDLQRLADPARGLTINVGVIDGGTRPNVVAESARAVVDVRIAHLEDAEGIERSLRGLTAHDSRVSLTVTGGINRPPMERSAGVQRLFRLAQSVAAEMSEVLTEGSTGGGSDGNFSAALGVPTLDGLGALGDGAHAIHEHVTIKDLVPRVALAAGLIARLGDTRFQ